MSDFISPYEISEMFHKKFDGFDFAQPYLNGVFEDDPKKGRITIGVRTPWYDFEYFVYSKESFWGCIANVESVEDVIQGAVGHLNAAVAMQLAVSGSTQRFDLDDINKYQADPEGYIEESEPEVQQPYNNREFDIHVNHDSKWSDDALMEAESVHFLCDCKSCMDLMDQVIKARAKGQWL